MAKTTSPSMDKIDKEYQAASDLRTLIEARKIMADKPRLNAAMKKRKDEMAALTSLDSKKGD